jgi:hypothetical protein
MAIPDLTRTGFRTPRSFNDLARSRSKIKDFNRFPKIIQGSAGSDAANGGGGNSGGGNSGGGNSGGGNSGGGGSASPTYTASGASSSVNEGSALTINVTTSNVSDGTTLYYTIGGNASDLQAPESGGGYFVISSNAASFTVTPTADSSTEGPETFTVQIRTDNTNGSIVATTGSITINDTSTGSASPTYDATPTATSIDEGSALTINVTTSNVSDATTLYYTILGNTGDFSTTSGSFTITSNAGSFTVTPTADATTEGTTETFQVQIRTGSTGGTVVDTTDAITINDTSQTPAFSPDYTLSVSHGTTGYYTLVGTDRSGSINGDNPTLAFNAGDKVRFSNSVSGNHPLYIKTVQGTGTGNQASGVSGAGTATVDWTIPAGSGTYYYQCSVHSNMVGTITVTSGSGY